MKIVDATYGFVTPLPDLMYSIIKLESIGRVSHKSEDQMDENSVGPFLKGLISKHHESVLEHASATVMIRCNRGVSHELVRHRMASFTQESTRYCNYSKGKFDGELTFINPKAFDWKSDSGYMTRWTNLMKSAEDNYLAMISEGCTPQEARDILPTALKTDVIITANIREWRHILSIRSTKDNHPQMREIMVPLLFDFDKGIPFLFEDLLDKPDYKDIEKYVIRNQVQNAGPAA
jgi:thymidylate synthase (FAD)